MFVNDEDLKAAEAAGPHRRRRTERAAGERSANEEETDAEIERLFKECDAVVEGHYGIDVITHCAWSRTARRASGTATS